MRHKDHLGIKCHTQYNKVIRVLPIVNGGDLETIIVLVLLVFNLIPQRLHYSLTLPMSRIRDSATVTLMPLDAAIAIKVQSSA